MKKSPDAVSLKRFDPRQDLQRLKKWLNSPHVRKWWGDPEQQLARIFREQGGGKYVIMAGDSAIGYVQWQRVLREELDGAGLEDIPDGTVDIDIAIGEIEYLGQNIGPAVLDILIRSCLPADRPPVIMMATAVNNKMAIRSFAKAGFRKQRIFADPEYGDMLLLTRSD